MRPELFIGFVPDFLPTKLEVVMRMRKMRLTLLTGFVLIPVNNEVTIQVPSAI
jgi:hypothetical protein